MQRCIFSKTGCLQIQSGVRNSAKEERLFSGHLGIFYLSDLPNSSQQLCGRGKDFIDVFPSQFSAALTGSLSISSLIHYMPPTSCNKWSRGPSGCSLDHLAVPIYLLIESCQHGDGNGGKDKGAVMKFAINRFMGAAVG